MRESAFNREIEQLDGNFSRHKFIQERKFNTKAELLGEVAAFCSPSALERIQTLYEFDNSGVGKGDEDLRDLLFELYFTRIKVYATERIAEGGDKQQMNKMLDNEAYYKKPMQPALLDDELVTRVVSNWQAENENMNKIEGSTTNWSEPTQGGYDG